MKKPNKKKNPVAKQLKHYKQQIVKKKTLYDRKKEQQMLHHSQTL